MDWFIIGLRIVHIVSGMLWIGAAVVFVLYIRPTLVALGPDAQKVVSELVVRRRLTTYFLVVSSLTVLAGAVLYWRVSGGLQWQWITRPTGLGFTVGAVAAIIAWPIGNITLRRAFARVGEIGAEMNTAGGPPSAEVMARLREAQARVRSIGLLVLALLAVAAIAMESARYLR